MVLDAFLTVFGPSIVMITALDIAFLKNAGGIRDKIAGWYRRALKLGLSVGSNLWVIVALNNAQNWGVNEANLQFIRDAFTTIQNQIPFLTALPGEVFQFIVMFFIVFLLLY